jgi:hypothetical protein
MRTIEEIVDIGQHTITVGGREITGTVDMTVIRPLRAFETNSPRGGASRREFVLYAHDRSVWGKTPERGWFRIF